MDKELLIIMPAYNEEKNIGAFLRSLRDAGIFNIADVLVINDGSSDNTSAEAKENGAEIITLIYNLGYGCALQTGYKYAVREGYKYLIQMDGDGQHDVCNIKTIFQALSDPVDAPDIVIGSRFLKNSKSFPVSTAKKIATNFFRAFIWFSTRHEILDTTSGLQGISRAAFLYCSYYNNFVSDFPDANMIIQMLLNNFKVEEVPAVMHEREAGESMHSGLKPILYLFKMVVNTVIVIVREKINSRKKINLKIH